MKKAKGSNTSAEHELLLREASKIVEALGKTLAPFCEVVLHDLTHPDHAIVRIENNLSSRRIGDSATELGLARISDPSLPDQIVNYVNQLPNGQPLKSTSIGLRDSEGQFIAAICLNFDVGFFNDVVSYIKEFTRATPLSLGFNEFRAPTDRSSLEFAVRQFAAKRNVQPRALSGHQRHELLAELKRAGLLELRGAISRVAALLGVSRTTIYHYIS